MLLYLSPNEESALERHSRTAPSVEAHQCVNSPDTEKFRRKADKKIILSFFGQSTMDHIVSLIKTDPNIKITFLTLRYWNQLNEDIRILLQRFDAETGDESEKSNEHDATTSFLTQLATWHKQELDEKLASRVQVSQRAVAKIIQVIYRRLSR